MTSQELSELQKIFGSDWYIRIINSEPRATRRRTLSDDELSADMKMTLFDGDGGPLATLLLEQRGIEADLVKTALS